MMTWFHSIFGVRIELTPKELIFGIPNPYDDKIINYINFCIINTKHYIYKEKMAEKTTKLALLYSFHKERNNNKRRNGKNKHARKKIQQRMG